MAVPTTITIFDDENHLDGTPIINAPVSIRLLVGGTDSQPSVEQVSGMGIRLLTDTTGHWTTAAVRGADFTPGAVFEVDTPSFGKYRGVVPATANNRCSTLRDDTK